MSERGQNRKKRAASVLALLAAAGVTVNALFASPEELLRPDAQLPDAAWSDTLLPDGGDDGDDGDAGEPDDGEKMRRRSGLRAVLRQRLERLPLALRCLLLLPLWLLGGALTAAGTALWSAAAPLLRGLLGFLLRAALLLGGFLAAASLLFPDLPLKKLLNRRTLPRLLLGALALSGAEALLAALWPDYAAARRWVSAAAMTALLALLSLAVYRRARRRERLEAARRAPELPEAEEPQPGVVRFTGPGGEFELRTAPPKES